MTLRFQPDDDLLAELHARCVTPEGLVHVTCRWSDRDSCLVIQDLRLDRKTWSVQVRLIDAEGLPRQMTMRDIDDAEARTVGRRLVLDRWLEKAREAAARNDFSRWLNESREEKEKATFHDAIAQGEREMERDAKRQPTEGWHRCRHGKLVGYCGWCDMAARGGPASITLPSGSKLRASP